MVGSDESLHRENLVGCERAEYVRDPQSLRIAVEDDVCSGYSSKRLLCVLLGGLAINVCSEEEAVIGEFRHIDSS